MREGDDNHTPMGGRGTASSKEVVSTGALKREYSNTNNKNRRSKKFHKTKGTQISSGNTGKIEFF